MVIINTNPIYVHDIKTIIRVLQDGEFDLISQVLSGSNYTFLANVKLNEIQFKVLYKPTRGERPLWDFPNLTLAKREVAAFITSYLLKWNFVPPTVYRSGLIPYGNGSLQLFIPHNPEINYFNMQLKHKEIIQKIIIFDFIINNADRKGGHLLLDNMNKIWLIDHGVSFHSDYKLRTVIWDYAGKQIPSSLLINIKNFIEGLKSKRTALGRKLEKLLSPTEIQNMIHRTEYILSNQVFPEPESNFHSYPWPPI